MSIAYSAGTIAACAVLLGFFAVTSFRATLGKSAAFDEPLHYVGAWLQTHYDDYRCNPEDPSLWKYYVAAGTARSDLKPDFRQGVWNQMLAEVPAPAEHFIRQMLYQTPGVWADGLLRSARLRMTAIGIALGAAIAWWAWRLAGRVAAVVAAAAFAFDPNFLAHAPLVKNDVPITFVFFALMGVIWLAGERATLVRLGGICLLVATALLTKYSGVLALPMLAIALCCRVLIARPWPFLRWTLLTSARRLVGAVLIFVAAIVFSYAAVWASYGFRFGPTPDPAQVFDFHSANYNAGVGEILLTKDPVPIYPGNQVLHQWVAFDWKPSLLVRTINAANKHHLLPEPWLFGFLYTYGTSLYRRGFLCGNISVVGWWYYFPAAMAFKTPLATLAALALTAALWCLGPRSRFRQTNPWPVCAAVVCPAFYFAVAMRSHLNIGLRHIFPVYPFLFVFIGVVAAGAFGRRPKLTAAIIGLLFAGLVTETLCAYPNFIPFFNVAVGGSRGGLALLSDSNIDWGEELPALADWQRNHLDRQLLLCQFAFADPRVYGLRYFEMDGSEFKQPDQAAPSGLPVVYAISAVALQGTYMNPQQLSFYTRFLKEKPVEVIDGSTYLFDHPPP